MLVLTYQREFTKGHWRKKEWELPIHGFYEIYKDDVPLFFNLLTFFLLLASADHAFRDYSSIDDLLDAAEAYEVNSSVNKIFEVIYFADSVRDVPLIRPFNELLIEKSTGKARGVDAFGKEFANLGYRSGYTRNITVRGCRRWALMQAGKNPAE